MKTDQEIALLAEAEPTEAQILNQAWKEVLEVGERYVEQHRKATALSIELRQAVKKARLIEVGHWP